MSTLTFEPTIALSLWLALAGSGAALLAGYGWRRPAGASPRRWLAILTLMGVGMTAVLVVLLNPTWLEPAQPPAGKPVLTILLDGSASMATKDGGEGLSRYQAGLRIASSIAAQAGERFDVKTATFADAVVPREKAELSAHDPKGSVSNLAKALAATLEESRPQGQSILLLSDGIHNAGGGTASVLDAARIAKAMACPVYTRTFGGDAAVKDLAVELSSSQELAYPGQKLRVGAYLRQRGFTGATAKVSLFHEGKSIQDLQIPLAGRDLVETAFVVYQEKPGLYRYEVKAEALPGEVSLVNNSAPLLVRVVSQPVRILLLEGKPYWDNKFLMRALASDASIELDSLVRMSVGRLYRRTLRRIKDTSEVKPANEWSEDWKIVPDLPQFLGAGGLSAYQVVVLGRDTDIFLSDAVLEMMRRWVSTDGGCLVCYRGQPMVQLNQKLATLLPVRWSPGREARFRMSLTERGKDLRWLPVGTGQGDALANLPSLATFARPEQPRPLTVVLATSGAPAPDGDSPVVSYQPYGAGRTVVIEGSGMWRWAFLPPEQKQHEEVYRSLWNSLIRWLASTAALLPGQNMALRTDKVSFAVGEIAGATLLVREEAAKEKIPDVELLTEGGMKAFTPSAIGDELGAFRVNFGALPEGRYQARIAGVASGDPSAVIAFDVRSMFDEQLDLKARPDVMARIAKDSGGAVLEGATPVEAATQFFDQIARSRPVRVRRLIGWDRWWVLVGILGLWGGAWALRRSGGLV